VGMNTLETADEEESSRAFFVSSPRVIYQALAQSTEATIEATIMSPYMSPYNCGYIRV